MKLKIHRGHTGAAPQDAEAATYSLDPIWAIFDEKDTKDKIVHEIFCSQLVVNGYKRSEGRNWKSLNP
jgi:hypothetical protein